MPRGKKRSAVCYFIKDFVLLRLGFWLFKKLVNLAVLTKNNRKEQLERSTGRAGAVNEGALYEGTAPADFGEDLNG